MDSHSLDKYFANTLDFFKMLNFFYIYCHDTSIKKKNLTQYSSHIYLSVHFSSLTIDLIVIKVLFFVSSIVSTTTNDMSM